MLCGIQEMCSFPKGRILCCIVIGDIENPQKRKDEGEEKLTEWLRNGRTRTIRFWLDLTILVPMLSNWKFVRFYTAKEVWDFLQSSYSISDNIPQFYLYHQHHHMQQPPEQTIHTYIFELQVSWDQLSVCDPIWLDIKATKMFADLCDRQHVWHLLMMGLSLLRVLYSITALFLNLILRLKSWFMRRLV